MIQLHNQIFQSVRLTDTLDDEDLIIRYNKIIARVEEEDDFYPLEIFVAILSYNIFNTLQEKIFFIESKDKVLLIFANTTKKTVIINKDDEELLNRNILRVVLGLDYQPYSINFTNEQLKHIDDKIINKTIKNLPQVRNKKSEDRSYTIFAIGIILVFLFNSVFIKPRIIKELETQKQTIDALSQEKHKLESKIKSIFKQIKLKTPKDKFLNIPPHTPDYTKIYKNFVTKHKKQPSYFEIKNGQIKYYE